jgi:hypothetical protein
MAKISKALAESIVNKVLDKLQKKENEYNREFLDKAVEYYVSKVPADVMKVFNDPKCFSYINRTTNFYLSGMGFNSLYLDVKTKVPNRQESLLPTAAEAKVLQKLYDKLIDTRQKIKQTKIELTATLLGLGTTKRIAEQLPDLIPYLPDDKKNSMGIMCVPEKMKQTVSCLLSEDSKCLDKI